MYKNAKSAPPDKVPQAADPVALFEECLDRFEESVREETQAVGSRDSRKANDCTDRKLRLRKALIEYVMALYKGDD